MIAAASVERPQVRKVRASQGRMPDNVRWRRLQGKCNRNIPPILAMPESGKGGRAVQETTAFLVTGGAYVNPIRSKTEQKAMWLPVTLLGGSLEPAGNSRSR